MKHIYLDKTFWLFLVIIILTGNFNYFIVYFALLFVHELSHAITGIILGYKLVKIEFYPLGGVTILDLPINISLLKETTKRQKCKAWKAFLSSLFIFIATGLTKDNLEI